MPSFITLTSAEDLVAVSEVTLTTEDFVERLCTLAPGAGSPEVLRGILSAIMKQSLSEYRRDRGCAVSAAELSASGPQRTPPTGPAARSDR